jgi:hypothetical protein
MPVHTGHQTQSDGPSYSLCNLPLVLRPQPGVIGVLYPAHFRHVLGHHGEVLSRVSLRPSAHGLVFAPCTPAPG